MYYNNELLIEFDTSKSILVSILTTSLIALMYTGSITSLITFLVNAFSNNEKIKKFFNILLYIQLIVISIFHFKIIISLETFNLTNFLNVPGVFESFICIIILLLLLINLGFLFFSKKEIPIQRRSYMILITILGILGSLRSIYYYTQLIQMTFIYIYFFIFVILVSIYYFYTINKNPVDNFKKLKYYSNSDKKEKNTKIYLEEENKETEKPIRLEY